MKDETRVKVERAKQIRDRIKLLCIKQLKQPNSSNLQMIGSLFGDFVNNLRSALNYTMVDYVEQRLRPKLSSKEYRQIVRRRDFPWADDPQRFESKKVIEFSKQHCKDIYHFLEQVQPYHASNEWLGHLMRFSNQDKHEILIDINDARVVGIAMEGPPGKQPVIPKFAGDKLWIPRKQGKPVIFQLPIYFAPFHAFAIEGGKWVFFFLEIEEGKFKGLIPFVDGIPQAVEKLVTDFEALI